LIDNATSDLTHQSLQAGTVHILTLKESWEEEREKITAEGQHVLTRTSPVEEGMKYRVQVVKPIKDAVPVADFHAGKGIKKGASVEDREKPFRLPDLTRTLLIDDWKEMVR